MGGGGGWGKEGAISGRDDRPHVVKNQEVTTGRNDTWGKAKTRGSTRILSDFAKERHEEKKNQELKNSRTCKKKPGKQRPTAANQSS